MDLNADLAESFGVYTIGNDAEMLDIVTSANIACGFHAGDPQVLLRTVRQAAERGVRIGAHPGYRDLQGFGRRAMAYTPEDLYAEVVYQIGAVQAAAKTVNAQVSYVKPHGAMYNTIATDHALAAAVIKAVKDVDPGLKLMCLSGSPIVTQAQEAGLNVIKEAFADRAYTPEGRLAPRNQPGAVHHETSQVVAQALALATGSAITATDGSQLLIEVESICVHGDHPGALARTRELKKALLDAGVVVSA